MRAAGSEKRATLPRPSSPASAHASCHIPLLPGRRSLSDLHLFDTESMSWSKAAVSGRSPLAGSRHTASLVGDKLYVFGATDSGALFFFRPLLHGVPSALFCSLP